MPNAMPKMTSVAATIALLGLAGLSLPAGAQSTTPRAFGGFEYVGGDTGWQLVQPSYSPDGRRIERTGANGGPTGAVARSTVPTVDGFEYVGGEGGWQLAQHHYEFSSRGLAHAQDCDHAIRAAAAAPTAQELERANRLFGGA